MADTIFRVNMSDLSTKVEAVPEGWMGLGGRGSDIDHRRR